MPYFVILMRVLVYCAFIALTAYLIRKKMRFDLVVLFLGLAFVLTGELLNLFLFKMAVYNGTDGIPLYIVLAGAVLVWCLFAFTRRLSRSKRFNHHAYSQTMMILGSSLILPLVEFFGLKTSLWYWSRPYPILSLGWYLGVWKYYFVFIALPAILAALPLEKIKVFFR